MSYQLRRRYDQPRSLTMRCHDLATDLADCENPVGMFVINGRSAEVEALLAEGEAVLGKLQDALAVPGKAPTVSPTLVTKRAWLLEEIPAALAVHQALLLDAEHLRRLVRMFAATAERGEWYDANEPSIYGLLSYDVELRTTLRTAHGIDVWQGHSDPFIRVVRSRWLRSHRAIWEHVHIGDQRGGRACRQCRLIEPPNTVELHEYLAPMMTGTYARHKLPVHLHAACEPAWIDWCAIAAGYKSADEAAAADERDGLAREEITPLAHGVGIDSFVPRPAVPLGTGR